VDHRNDGSIRLFLAISCWAFAALTFLGISLFAWLLRDGLGPDSVESHGWLALSRYLKEAGWYLVIPATFLLSGSLLYRSDVHRPY
jgi:hypothetical protein